MTDYRTFFKETEKLSGGDFSCTLFPHAGSITHFGKGRYPILFILQGAANLHFKLQHTPLHSGHFIVIDNTKLIECTYSADTILLVYDTPAQLETYLGYCSTAFLTAHSTQVPILPPVEAWIKELLTTHIHNNLSDDERYLLRKELNKALLSTPQSMLGEVYIALSSCSTGDCARCATENSRSANCANQGGGNS